MQTLYRRPLPDDQIAFASVEGRAMFAEALEQGQLEGYFRLAQQFHTQAEPAYCGLASLVVALNALDIDPGRLWRGPWRWFSEELLDCCLPLETVQRQGIGLDQLGCLARCNGAKAQVHRPKEQDLAAFRDQVERACGDARGPIMLLNYDRASLGQTGSGHFSPIGAYHPPSDRALLLDVARFKYPPHWVELERLHAATEVQDPDTGLSRGWMLLQASPHKLSLGFLVDCEDGDWSSVSQSIYGELMRPETAPEGELEDFFREYLRSFQHLGLRLANRDALVTEHQRKIKALIEQLEQSPVWPYARAHHPEGQPALLAAVLLASPPATLLGRLPPALGRQWLALLSELPETLRDESSWIAEQLEQLAQLAPQAAPCSHQD